MKLKSRIKSAVIFLSYTLVVTLVLTEISVRLLGGEFGLEQRLDCSTEGLEDTYSSIYLLKITKQDGWRIYVINSGSYRDTVASGHRRAIVLGDSHTFGVNVNQNETFADLLDAHLPSTEFMNFASPGLGTVDQFLQYDEIEHRERHVLVILGFFGANDLRNNIRMLPFAEPWRAKAEFKDGAVKYERPVQSKARQQFNLSRYFHTYRLFERVRAVVGAQITKRLQGNAGIVAQLEYAAKLTRMVLDDLHAKTQEKNAPLVVVLIPSRGETLAGKYGFQNISLLAEFQQATPAFILLDLLPVFASHANPELLFGKGDYHISPAGHAMAADAILNTLHREGLLGRDEATKVGAAIPLDARLKDACSEHPDAYRQAISVR